MKKILLFCFLVSSVYGLYAQQFPFSPNGASFQPAQPANSGSSGFYENKGQFYDQDHKPAPGVKYLYHSSGFNVQLRQTGFSYDTYTTDSIPKEDIQKLKEKMKALKNKRDLVNIKRPASTIHFHRVDVELEGCNANAQITTEGKSADYENYYTTNVEKDGATDVHTYQKVIYKDIYPHIDLEFLAPSLQDSSSKTPEYNFIVHPGGNPADIKLAYKGANKVELKDDKLVVSVNAGDFTESIPSSYFKDTKEPVEVNYAGLGNNVFGFSLPPNTALKSDLVIDPNPNLIWGTYYGADKPHGDRILHIKLDANDDPYFTGQCSSTTAIASTGAYQTTITSNDYSQMLVKMSNTGKTRYWGTYIGQSANDPGAWGLAVDASGNAYVTGGTYDAGLGTTGTWESTLKGTSDAFVAKFNSAGTRSWFTYIGDGPGNSGDYGSDYGEGVAVDASGNVFATGGTYGTTGIYQSISGGYNQSASTNTGTMYNGNAYVMKFTSAGALTWGTFFAGSTGSWGIDIGIDASDNLYVTGDAFSTSGLPSGASGTSTDGGFLAKFSSAGVLDWDSYESDAGGCIVVDPANGNSFTAGGSTVAEFNSSGTQQWSTAYGGEIWGITFVGSADTIAVSGIFPGSATVATSDAYQPTATCNNNAYLGVFSSAGTFFVGSYYGQGSDWTNGYCIAGDPDTLYMGGETIDITGTTGEWEASPVATTFYEAYLSKWNYDNPIVTTPITLLYFTCAPVSNGFVLTWATGSEQNNKYFTVERSSDGTNFYTLATITGAGNSDFTKYYSYVDENPLNGINYYRLSQTDDFGNTVQDNITACNEEDSTLVYPNPASGVFAIKLPTKDIMTPTTITLYDVLGQKILSQTAQNQQIINISIPTVASGIYLLRIITSEKTYNIKLLIRK